MDKQLNEIEDIDKRNSAIAHLYGVSLAATMIAKKRGLDPEIASMAAMLHDLHAYKTGWVIQLYPMSSCQASESRTVLQEILPGSGCE